MPSIKDRSRTVLDSTDDTNLWEFVSDDAHNLFLRVVVIDPADVEHKRE